ncbi:hypothetical protein ROA7745_03835 [Roseovarius aestuarii]|uniref:Flippase-like domain-containing protein n=2 Tax=Roseovarius aestuarii TaxID=475083 RepID=A0A1X7BWH3_9RHOB|nr:hypothetical protein ROA7745_03835 [Roseovarius aestuarii]
MMFLRSGMFLLLSLILVICAVVWSGLDLRNLLHRLIEAPHWLLLCFIVLTGIQITISAIKWRIVVNQLTPETSPPGFSFFLTCSSASALLSQLLTTYVSSVVVRGWAGRRFHGIPITRGAGSSVFEQLFDVVVLMCIAIGTLITWIVGGGALTWVLFVTLFVVLGMLASTRLNHIIPVLRQLHPKLSGHEALLDDCGIARICSGPTVSALYGLSVLRYLVMLARAPLIVIALGYSISSLDAAQGFTIVQTTQLAAFTPGNLGLQEWGWSGVLAFLGYGFEKPLEFALALRVMGLTSMIIVTPLLMAPVFSARKAMA